MTIEVDNTAKAGGLAAALLSWFSGMMSYAFHPAETGPLIQIVITIVGGLFGIAGTTVAVAVKHWLENRKKDKD